MPSERYTKETLFEGGDIPPDNHKLIPGLPEFQILILLINNPLIIVMN